MARVVLCGVSSDAYLNAEVGSTELNLVAVTAQASRLLNQAETGTGSDDNTSTTNLLPVNSAVPCQAHEQWLQLVAESIASMSRLQTGPDYRRCKTVGQLWYSITGEALAAL